MNTLAVSWLTSMNRKRHQRAMNKLVRDVNKVIQKDELWQGRFYARQSQAYWYVYEDKSGAELLVFIQFIDKKTGLTYETAATVNEWRHLNNFKMFSAMNDFIVHYVDVWNERPAPGSAEWFERIDWN